jgi:exosortase A-associated hydrolase 2
MRGAGLPGVDFRSQTTAFFEGLSGVAGESQRLFLWHLPPESCAASPAVVIFVPPFAEEMNKSRRMVALQARLLADAGLAVLQVDLFGTGDSSGDFVDASWAIWIDDVAIACDVALRRYKDRWPTAAAPQVWLWGLRTGCLLASAAASRIGLPVNFLFWQATVSGKAALQQFLRLKLAASLGQGDTKGLVENLRSEIADGRAVNIAGYELPAALALGLEAARLSPPAQGGRLLWLELSLQASGTMMPVSQTAVAQWRDAGHSVDTAVVPGPSFWSTVEIEEAPALLVASTEMLCQALRS